MGKVINMLDFYKGKKVFVTGHTGFKGSWLCRILLCLGAEITGYALPPDPDNNLFEIADIEKNIRHVTGDVRDYEKIKSAFEAAQPEIVFHLAAQPLVRESYNAPCYTYETNVMGTVNVLECARGCQNTKSILNVTTDKVYRNDESGNGFSEEDFLDGYDPYSNSKSCSELVTHSYDRSFFKEKTVAVSTARAGNVIGGGDFAKDRIIPDCVRSAAAGNDILIRNPYSVRPFQHVIEPLFAYLMIAQKQYENIEYAGSYNIGPDEGNCVTVGQLADVFCREWGGISWKNISEKDAPHEAGFLRLNCDKLKNTFGWKPLWNIDKTVRLICRFSKNLTENMSEEMNSEIDEFLEDCKNAGMGK